jgi:hypothetical protein
MIHYAVLLVQIHHLKYLTVIPQFLHKYLPPTYVSSTAHFISSELFAITRNLGFELQTWCTDFSVMLKPSTTLNRRKKDIDNEK